MLKTKKIWALILLIALCLSSFSLVSCSMEGIDNAKTHAKSCLSEVRKGNFEEAEKYLHPDYNENSLKEYFDYIEAEYDIDFQSGIALLGYSGVYSSYYTTEVDGSLYEIYHELEVSGVRITAYVAIIENDNGYGIGDIVIE